MTTFRDNKKKIIVVLVIVIVICALVFIARGNKNYDTEIKGDITVENVAGIINDNLKEQGKHLSMGSISISYVNYLKDILMQDFDKSLQKSPYYDEIKIYAANYVDFNEITSSGYLSPNRFLPLFREIPENMKGKKIKELPVEK